MLHTPGYCFSSLISKVQSCNSILASLQHCFRRGHRLVSISFFVPSSLSSFPPSPSPSGTLSSSCFPLRLFIARAIVAATAALKNDPSFFFSRPPDRLTPTSIVASVADFGPTIPYCGLAPSPHHHLIPSNDWHPVHALLDAASQISSKSSATGVWFGSFTSLRSSVNRKLTYGPLSPGCFVQSVSRPLRRPEMADVMKR